MVTRVRIPKSKMPKLSTHGQNPGGSQQELEEPGRGAVSEITECKRAAVIETLPVSSLRPNPRNARRHGERQIAQLCASISEFGFVLPVLIDDEGHILAGHARHSAAIKMGLTEVPVIRVTHLTPVQKRAYALADNRLAELAEWDTELLQSELAELSKALDIDVEITGFNTADIDRILSLDYTLTDKPDPDDVLPPIDEQGAAISKRGDVWLLGVHRLICGDARDPDTYTGLLRGEKAEMVFTDPPYNVRIGGHAVGMERHREFPMASGELSAEEFTGFLQRAFQMMAECSTDGAIHFACMDWRHLREILTAAAAIYDAPKQLCVWVKDNGGMGSFYRSQHELVFVFKVGEGPHINNFGLGGKGRYRTNVWQYRGANSLAPGRTEMLTMHPTVKPVAMVVDAIKDCSRRGGIVLDPFGGSGTTLIAAERSGRRARLVELDPRYVDLIIRRWQLLTGDIAKHAQTNESFDEISRLLSDREVRP